MSNIESKTITINGLDIALKIYNNTAQGVPVLALHGWLDNAASFDNLAPLLTDLRLITFDLPGHGLSSHRGQGAEYYIWSYIEDVIGVADALGLECFSLLGHSMGGAISCLISSLYPSRVHKMVLLDAMGPLTTAPEDALPQMKKALRQKQGLKSHEVRHYATRQLAIEARARKGLTFDSATLLASRGVAEDDAGFFWVNDPRLSRANLMSMNKPQVEAFFKEIACGCCLIVATESWNNRKNGFKECLSHLAKHHDFAIHELDGNHHQHLEGLVTMVADRVKAFL